MDLSDHKSDRQYRGWVSVLACDKWKVRKWTVVFYLYLMKSHL